MFYCPFNNAQFSHSHSHSINLLFRFKNVKTQLMYRSKYLLVARRGPRRYACRYILVAATGEPGCTVHVQELVICRIGFLSGRGCGTLRITALLIMRSVQMRSAAVSKRSHSVGEAGSVYRVILLILICVSASCASWNLFGFMPCVLRVRPGSLVVTLVRVICRIGFLSGRDGRTFWIVEQTLSRCVSVLGVVLISSDHSMRPVSVIT